MIDWDGDEDEEGFPELRKCVNTGHLISRNLNTATIVAFLRVCGSTLEQLEVSIRPFRDSAEVVQAIQHCCKQLRVIKIPFLEHVLEIVGQESYSSLLRSYGSQLRDATLDGLEPNHLVEVANACMNLEVTVSGATGACNWQHVHALGPRMVYLNAHDKLLHGNEYPRALEQCSNLRKLFLSGTEGNDTPEVTDEMIGNVFVQSRFPKLEHLSIEDFVASERNLSLISLCTTNLKSASFVPFEWDSKVSGFMFIADSNRHLNEIEIQIYESGEAGENAETALESLRELVKMFRKCRKLTLGISCSDEREATKENLINICKILPCRGMNVLVGIENIHYGYSG